MNYLLLTGLLFFLPASATMPLTTYSRDVRQLCNKDITWFNQKVLKQQSEQQFLKNEEVHINTMNQFGLPYTPENLTEFAKLYIESRIIPDGCRDSLQKMYQGMQAILNNKNICTEMMEQEPMCKHFFPLLMAAGNKVLEPTLTSTFFDGDPSAVYSLRQLSALGAFARITEHPSKPKPRSLSSAEILVLSPEQLQLYNYIEQTTTIPRIERSLLSIFLSPTQEQIAKTLPPFITKKILFRDLVFNCQLPAGTMRYVGKFFIKNPTCIFALALCAPFAPIILSLTLRNKYKSDKIK
jgi:hypothetical protein